MQRLGDSESELTAAIFRHFRSGLNCFTAGGGPGRRGTQPLSSCFSNISVVIRNWNPCGTTSIDKQVEIHQLYDKLEKLCSKMQRTDIGIPKRNHCIEAVKNQPGKIEGVCSWRSGCLSERDVQGGRMQSCRDSPGDEAFENHGQKRQRDCCGAGLACFMLPKSKDFPDIPSILLCFDDASWYFMFG